MQMYILIDEDTSPLVHAALMQIPKGKRRAAAVRTYAESFLAMKAVGNTSTATRSNDFSANPSAPQSQHTASAAGGFDDNGASAVDNLMDSWNADALFTSGT